MVALALVLGRSVGSLWWSALVFGVLAGVSGFVTIYEVGEAADDALAVLGVVFLPMYQLMAMVPILTVRILIGEFVRWRRARARQAV